MTLLPSTGSGVVGGHCQPNALHGPSLLNAPLKSTIRPANIKKRPAGVLLHGGGGGMVVEGLEDGSNAPLPGNLHLVVGIVHSEVAQRPAGLLLHGGGGGKVVEGLEDGL